MAETFSGKGARIARWIELRPECWQNRWRDKSSRGRAAPIVSRRPRFNDGALTTAFWELLMTAILTTEAISRRKALTLLGLATAAFAASSVVSAPDAEAQTAGMERRQERRGGRQDRRQARRTGRTERRQERRQ